MKKYTKLNLRATTDKQFWGEEYDDHVFLWPGSMHDQKLSEIDESKIVTDPFFEKSEFIKAHDFCKEKYYKLIPELKKIYNKEFNQNYSETFYKTMFGYWLFRHISIVYDKYRKLKLIDINNCDIKLLKSKSYYTPFDHFDYFNCFCLDFGVIQLITIYCDMFIKNKFEKQELLSDVDYEINEILKTHPPNFKFKIWLKNKMRLIVSSNFTRNKIVFISTFFTKEIKEKFINTSIGIFKNTPAAKLNFKNIDFEKRKQFKKLVNNNEFESFLSNTISVCMPKSFLEYFNDYKKIYLKNIKHLFYKAICSESWISVIPTSIYIGLCRENGVKLISYEHAANTILYERNPLWHESEISDYFITTGWKINEKDIEGGFCIRNIKHYKKTGSKRILYIDFMRPPFIIEFIGSNQSNNRYLEQIKFVDDFLKLTNKLKNFEFRPRYANWAWNTEATLNLNERGINIDKLKFEESIQNVKIIIINHLSTGLAEIVLNNIPFIIVQNKSIEVYNKKFQFIINLLHESNILYYSNANAVDHVKKNTDEICEWWSSEKVQSAIECYKKYILKNHYNAIKKLEELKDF